MSEEKSFEEKLKELEDLVNDLEKGELPLEESIAKFENGINISKECHKKLEEAEKKINILIGDNEEPFSAEE